jgi:hypothetical protein
LTFLADDLDHLAAVLQNCARHKPVGEWLLEQASADAVPRLEKVVLNLGVGSAVRRRGLAHVLRNVALDQTTHEPLFRSTSTLKQVESRLMADDAVAAVDSSHDAIESDVETQRALLDVLLLLTHTDNGRQYMFDAKLVDKLDNFRSSTTDTLDQSVIDICDQVLEELRKPRFKML